jgi:hypothetical protein
MARSDLLRSKVGIEANDVGLGESLDTRKALSLKDTYLGAKSLYQPTSTNLQPFLQYR